MIVDFHAAAVRRLEDRIAALERTHSALTARSAQLDAELVGIVATLADAATAANLALYLKWCRDPDLVADCATWEALELTLLATLPQPPPDDPPGRSRPIPRYGLAA